MAKHQPFVIPAGVRFDIDEQGFSIEHQGDIILHDSLGKHLRTVVSHEGAITLRGRFQVDTVEAPRGKVRLEGSVEARRVVGDVVEIAGRRFRADAVQGGRQVVIGPTRIQADVVVAPRIDIHPKATGGVPVMECHNDLGATAIKGGFTVAEYDELFGGADAYLAERGVSSLPPSPDAEEDEEEEDDEEPSQAVIEAHGADDDEALSGSFAVDAIEESVEDPETDPGEPAPYDEDSEEESFDVDELDASAYEPIREPIRDPIPDTVADIDYDANTPVVGEQEPAPARLHLPAGAAQPDASASLYGEPSAEDEGESPTPGDMGPADMSPEETGPGSEPPAAPPPEPVEELPGEEPPAEILEEEPEPLPLEPDPPAVAEPEPHPAGAHRAGPKEVSPEAVRAVGHEEESDVSTPTEAEEELDPELVPERDQELDQGLDQGLDQDGGDPIYDALQEVLTSLRACYEGTEMPPVFDDLAEMVERREYEAIQRELPHVWNELVKFHREKGMRIRRQVTTTFNSIMQIAKGAR